MLGAVPRAWGAWLAIVVFASASFVLGQAPVPPALDQPMSSRKPRAEDKQKISEVQQRLEEMKVELALLADIDAFPYSVGACVRDDTMQLYGFVPDAIIRKNLVDLARRVTFFKVSDGMAIRTDLNVQTTPRPTAVLQQEGNSLLLSHARDRAKQISLRVREDGVVVLTGRIDSLERKLRLSRLFRQLSGCAGVDNQLTVEVVARNGKQMVRVTQDGELLVPLSVLGLQSEGLAATLAPSQKLEQVSFPAKDASTPESRKPIVLPTVPAPLPTNTPEANSSESRWPPPVVSEKASAQSKREPAPRKDEREGPTAPKLPVKWARPNEGWETRMKQLETVRDRRTPAPPALPQPAQVPSPYNPSGERPNASSKPQAEVQNHGKADAPPMFAETQVVQPPQMTWRRFGSEEGSEARNTPAAVERDVTSKIAASATPLGPPVRASRRWPPAYVTAPPRGQGKTGTIVFADEPQPAPSALAANSTPRRILPADLQRQIKALCGRRASEVAVSVHLDGSLLVRVKVADRTVEDQLSRQILAMPDMSSPRVRLLMDVGP